MTQDNDLAEAIRNIFGGQVPMPQPALDLEHRKNYHKAFRFALAIGLKMNLLADKSVLDLLEPGEDQFTVQILQKMSSEELALFRIGADSVLTMFKGLKDAVKRELLQRQYDNAREFANQMEMPEIPGFTELSMKEPELDSRNGAGIDA